MYAGFNASYSTSWNSLAEAMLLGEYDLGAANLTPSDQSNVYQSVRFVKKSEIESLAQAVLSEVSVKRLGRAELLDICHREKSKNGLTLNLSTNNPSRFFNAIGSICFDPLEIWVFAEGPELDPRARFTLAHELGHYFLGHGEYMLREYSADEDLLEESAPEIFDADLRRLEWQANHFASCVLMPKSQIEADFATLTESLSLADKGFGALYVDNQACNLNSYFLITGKLMQDYRVSRQAVTYRLVDLGLIRDKRYSEAPHFVSLALSHLFRDDDTERL